MKLTLKYRMYYRVHFLKRFVMIPLPGYHSREAALFFTNM